MSHYKPYPAYKDSGVEWIGEVPEGWDVARINPSPRESPRFSHGEESGKLVLT
ncbi:hypothetical protein [Ferrovum myxofaciens]|jgi:type I restriction enzyme S subunit|uniref:Restriction endonuclease subunit S n=1 Tax=Ferrovum myxofaciens TaxID=416213 RepID=A0A9E6SX69_9PROT|nr:hypothetical protein [Ferrovum myxofaciens]QSH81870.1 MAG: hypothetical protein HO273_13990 [Ferrovum myxofaciens]QWY74386.1 MAG: hypothetical protein JVY19_11350 [Ferrovum myxofaciens]QWY77139.1 MAG: hypothetical protein JZL65_11795 [Ferrovum myxofaciens]